MGVNTRVDANIGMSLARTFRPNKQGNYQYTLAFPEHLELGEFLFTVFAKHKFKKVDFKRGAYHTNDINKFVKILDYACQSGYLLEEEREKINKDVLNIEYPELAVDDKEAAALLNVGCQELVADDEEEAKAIAASLEDFRRLQEEEEEFAAALAASLKDLESCPQPEDEPILATSLKLVEVAKQVLEPIKQPEVVEVKQAHSLPAAPRPLPAAPRPLPAAPRPLPAPKESQQAQVIQPADNCDGQGLVLPPPPATSNGQSVDLPIVLPPAPGKLSKQIHPLNKSILKTQENRKPKNLEIVLETPSVAPNEPMKRGSPPPPPPPKKEAVATNETLVKKPVQTKDKLEQKPSSISVSHFAKSFESMNIVLKKPVAKEDDLQEDAWESEEEIAPSFTQSPAVIAQANQKPDEKVRHAPLAQIHVPEAARNDLLATVGKQRSLVSMNVDESEDSWDSEVSSEGE